MPKPQQYSLAGNTLRVSGDLDADGEEDFAAAVRMLLDAGRPGMVIDLSDAKYVGSGYVRHIALAMMWATQSGFALAVRARRQPYRLCQLAGVDKLGTVELVED